MEDTKLSPELEKEEEKFPQPQLRNIDEDESDDEEEEDDSKSYEYYDEYEDEEDYLTDQDNFDSPESGANIKPSNSLPRKLIVYSDNLKDFEPQRLYIRSLRGAIEDMEIALRDTFNLSLMASTSFRFDPDLNLLEVTDTRFPRWHGIQSSHSEVNIEVKLFILANGYNSDDVPYGYIVRQVLGAMERQLGVRRVDLLLLSFSGVEICQLKQNPESVAGFTQFVDNMMGLWTQCERYIKYGRIKSLGVANFSPWQMDLLYEKVNTRPVVNSIRVRVEEEEQQGQVEQESSGDISASGGDAGSGEESGEAEEKAQGEIETKDEPEAFIYSDKIPDEVAEHAKKHNYKVTQHADNSDPLTDIMFAEMNRDFLVNQRFPTIEVPSKGAMVDIMFPRWAIHYTITNKKSGVIESRGYAAMVSSDSGRDPYQL